jgi:hypothetical protein
MARFIIESKSQARKRTAEAQGLLTAATSTSGDGEKWEGLPTAALRTSTPKKGKNRKSAIASAKLQKSSRRTPKKSKPSSKGKGNQRKPEIEWQGHCILPEYYAYPLRIYKCLKKPAFVACALSHWDKRRNIDTLKCDDDPESGIDVPDEAMYIVIGESIMIEGHALFFAAKVNENTVAERYDLKVGCYYKYPGSLYHWLDEVVVGNNEFPLVEQHQIVRRTNWGAFKPLYDAIMEAIDAELNVREVPGRRYFRFLPTSSHYSRRRDYVRRKEEVLVLFNG